MSSHHFVKEGQEPALVILDAVPFPSVENLLEWAPLVVVHEKSLDAVIRWGIKIDVVLARSVRVSDLTLELRDQAPIRIFSLEDSNDLSAILWILIALKQTSTYVATAEPKIFLQDHGLPVDKIQVSLVTEDRKWSHIPSSKFIKWLAKGTELGLHATGTITLSNLQHRGQGLMVQEDGPVEIAVSKSLWVAESIK